MLVGLVSTKVTASGTKSILLLALSTITSLLSELLAAYQSGAMDFAFGTALLTALTTFVLGVGVHYGFLKPTGVTNKLLETGRKAEPTP